MSKKRKTAWDDVPKENRKKLIITGIILAFVGVAIGGVIALLGIFNPMSGITTGEPAPEVDIHSVAEWQVPEGAEEKNSDNSTASINRVVIQFNTDQGQKLYDMNALTTGEWEDAVNDEELIEEKQDDGSTIFWWKDDMYDTGAASMSPDGDLVIDIVVTDMTGKEVYEDDSEYEQWRQEEFAELKDFVYTIKWK